MAEVSCPHVTQLPQGLGQVEIFMLRDCGNEGAESKKLSWGLPVARGNPYPSYLCCCLIAK